MRDACLLLFTKPARPGRVKTRLVRKPGDGKKGLSEEQAADLHLAFLNDLTRRLARGRFDLVLAWALDEGEPLPESDHANVRQEGQDLGERLFKALSDAGRRHRLVGAVGSDHPELVLEEVEKGLSLLRGGVDVVLGPATDGGFYFIGARAECLQPGLLAEIEWSTATVLEATMERCRQLSLSVMLLREGSDVDTPEDLERLSGRLGRVGDILAADCPETVALLRQWEAE